LLWPANLPPAIGLLESHHPSWRSEQLVRPAPKPSSRACCSFPTAIHSRSRSAHRPCRKELCRWLLQSLDRGTRGENEAQFHDCGTVPAPRSPCPPNPIFHSASCSQVP